MKKSILILGAVILTFGLMAIGFMNLKNSSNETTELSTIDTSVSEENTDINENFTYDLSSRFWATISEKDLRNAKSVLDIVPEDATTWRKIEFETVQVTALREPFEITESGTEKELNSGQSKLLRSLGYGSDFYIRALGSEADPHTGNVEVYNYYFSVVPEKQAEYPGGEEGLVEYIKESIKELVLKVDDKNLKNGRLNFTIDAEGSVSNISLESSCGYTNIDEAILNLMQNLPSKWDSAEDTQGKRIEQDLIFTFGMVGC